MKTSSQVVCVKCGQPVKVPVTSEVTGRLAHSGHVDSRLDRTCGQWAFRRVWDR